MKKMYFSLIAGLMLLSFAAITTAQVNVTIRVDMQEQTVSPDGVHVAGSFQGWDPAATEMTSLFEMIYEHTFQANPGDHVLYKYINGDSWNYPDQPESVPSQCGEDDGYGGFNRFFDVPGYDTVLTVVCFGSCVPCNVPEVDITFQVDMSNETVSEDGVHVAGTFNNWDTDSTQMTHIGDNIYAVILQLGEGEYHEYKFLNGNAWGTDESVPEECATGNNRYLTVPDQDSTLLEVCFGSCDVCTSVTDISVTFQVNMSEADSISSEGIHIAGGFQEWNPGSTVMTDMGGGIYSYTVILQSGSYQEYKFINHNTWAGAEDVPWWCNNNGNRYLTVPESDTILPAVCFESCLVCNPTPIDVTFNVDMSTQIVSDSGVHIAGSFQGWDPNATEMFYEGDNIYAVTLSLGEGEYHEYKFINGNTFDGAEIITGECANWNGNREFFVPSSTTVRDTVCFAECVQCTSELYTFNLKVLLEGPFNGNDMNTNLFDGGVLPVDQPFNVEPWLYDGTETLTAPAETDVVDWIYVQLRETTGDASTATADSLLDHQALVVLSDGTVVRPDGSPNFYYTGNITDNIYIVVYHRNHLAVMTATPVVAPFGTYYYNFSTDFSKAYLDGHKLLGGGMYGMIGGDSDANGIVDLNDKDVNWKNDAGSAGYYGSDLNLDSQVSNPDKNDIWDINNSSETQVPQ